MSISILFPSLVISVPLSVDEGNICFKSNLQVRSTPLCSHHHITFSITRSCHIREPCCLTQQLRNEGSFRDNRLQLRGRDRLAAIAERAVGVRVYLQDKPLRAGGNTGAGHGGYQLTAASGMAGIDYDRQVSQFVQQWHTGEIEQIARLRIEAAYATLTEHHIWIARCNNVFCRQQPFFKSSSQAALEHDGSAVAVLTCRTQQREGLHVA